MYKILIAAMLSASVAQANYNKAFTTKLAGYQRSTIKQMSASCIEDEWFVIPTDGCLYHYSEITFPKASEHTKGILCDDNGYGIGFENSPECKQWRSNQ